nr:NAD(P)/FAD-dependent oxidoreductase [Vibrio plantisponsor]
MLNFDFSLFLRNVVVTRIIVVGGGAGGLELATKLGRTLGRKNRADITLVDRKSSHLWKPLLHEVATGSLDEGVDALSYRAHAKNHSFDFQLGSLESIDRDSKKIVLSELCDDNGELLMPKRELSYDILVMAIGSTSNDFNTPGVRENCIFLDSPEQAHRFRTEMNNEFLKLHAKNGHGTVDIAIVGAGATGVELSAELHNAVKELRTYGFGDLDSSKLNVNLIEAGERILPALPPRISSAAHSELTKLGVNVRTATMVTQAEKDGLTTKDGEKITAQIMVWAAGIKAPDFMKDIAGLETNRINQLVVKNTLQTTRDDNIFAIGDLAQCTQADGSFVPPRAQAAHQMASQAFKNIVAMINGRELKPYVYKDHGSLVSLSRFSTVGSLMGNLTKGSMMVEGRIARVVYISLYRMHQMALHGIFKTGLMMLVGRINRVLRPNLKLH